MSRNTYDTATREHAIKLALSVGKAEAARRLNIRAGTIGSWMSRSGVATVATANLKMAVELRQATIEERRVRLADQLLAVAEKAAELELTKMEDARLYEVVGAGTRAIHDHQLLTGAATSRQETITHDTAKTMLDELAERRRSAA